MNIKFISIRMIVSSLVSVFLLLTTHATAYAWNWRSLWWRPDQQAYKKLQMGEAKSAAQQFENPNWRGVAYFKAEAYEDSAAEFAKNDTSAGWYNRGNALAHNGDIRQAIAAYEQALKHDSDNQDARYNRDLLLKFLERQKQKQQQAKQGKNHTQPSQQKQNNQNQKVVNNSKNKNARQQANGSAQNNLQRQNQPQESNQRNQTNKTQVNKDRNNSPQEKYQQAKNNGIKPSSDENKSKIKQSPQQHQKNKKMAHGSRRPLKLSRQANTQDKNPTTPSSQNNNKTQQAQRTKTDKVLEKWLQQIPDDPGGLLREKFLREHERMEQAG